MLVLPGHQSNETQEGFARHSAAQLDALVSCDHPSEVVEPYTTELLRNGGDSGQSGLDEDG